MSTAPLDVPRDERDLDVRPSPAEALQFYLFAGASVVLTVLLLVALVWDGARG